MMIPTYQTTLFHILKDSKLHYKKQLAILKTKASYDMLKQDSSNLTCICDVTH
jgi:hypothetical protein